MICHEARELSDRRPYGAVSVGSEIVLSCRSDAESITLLVRNGERTDEYPCVRSGDRHSARFFAPDTGSLLFYRFRSAWEETAERQITVYRPAEVPAWYKNAIVYQIFPDRFAREAAWRFREPERRKGAPRFTVADWDTPVFYPRDEQGAVSSWPFWGGTLRGIEEKLPYLASLGVSCLYLNPIFDALSNHRYDTADYERIDPLLGTEEDFVSLCRAAAERGIRIILDGVFSHTGADSVYFDKFGSFGSGERYRSWFRFGKQYRHGYECWWDVPDLPNVEENDPDYIEFICGENGVLRRWLRLGASGWRLDVADELPDAFIRRIREAVKAEKSDAVLLGEVWEDASNKVSYGEQRMYLMGEELDATMHYPFRAAVLDFVLFRSSAPMLCERLESIRENYPRENQLAALNLIGSHDRERTLTALGGDREAMKLLQVLQFACPGVPCLYYGDEAGMTGGADPYCRAPFSWGREETELAAHWRSLAALYSEHPAMRTGETAYFSRGEDVFGVTRTDGTERVSIAVDRAAKSWSIETERA